MIVVLKNNVSPEEENAVVEEIKKLGYRPHVMHGVARTVIGAIGVIGPKRLNYARIIPMVDYTAKVVGDLVG